MLSLMWSLGSRKGHESKRGTARDVERKKKEVGVEIARHW
jgi:hypothetical protein